MLEGAHFLTRERGPEVNQLIKHVVMHGRRLQVTAGCSAHCACHRFFHAL